ncbi:MAG: TCP-1/cpn60 chaperonin family protein [Candidatus Micrarchaeota archaeon]|nr:TCP-1/cpn60 chaperonin family protein [Candidatus Micrarchaeota archaeon]MCX8154809.1 TCP-1/cpn60 chaperonin family protein [Candidatus Micrarchaeota archaeon]
MANKISQDVMPEGSQRIIGRDAMRINIAIAYAIAQILKTTLGPKGMDKMLVSDLGDIIITNDGATILQEMNVDHPTAKLLVEVAKTQDKEVGDGTTTSVVIAGNLLRNAGQLIDKNIHPTTIVRGYELAEKKAQEELINIAGKVDVKKKEELKKIAKVALGSKGIGTDMDKDHIASMVVDAVTHVVERSDGRVVIDLDLIKIEKKAGGSVNDTQLIKGIVLDKEVVHSGMPKRVEKAKIALLDAPLEIEKTETDARISITSPDQLEAFLKKEEEILRRMVERIKAAGANVVFVQKGIDDVAQYYLAKHGILAARRVKKSDMDKLARATGARIATSIEDLTEKDLGYAELVEERKIGGESMIFVEGAKDSKSVTVFIRGGTEHVTSEVERAIKDSIGAVASVLKDGLYVVGGGATEVELAKRLREYAKSLGGREQLAVEAYAEALESIPSALAENAGMDPIDTIVELRAKHAEKNGIHYGVNVLEGRVDDMQKVGVLEPYRVKRQALASATEVARLILRIDDIIASKGSSKDNKKDTSSETDLD